MSTSSNRLIIGVAGTFSSGQDSLCHYLEERHGFLFISTSDIIREEAKKRYHSIERPVLRLTGTQLREEQGGGVLVNRALENYRKHENKYAGVAIPGIRSLGEFKAIKDAGGIVIFTDAPLELRFERMKARGRDAEVNITLEAFSEREAIEAGSGSSDTDFNRDRIKELADYILFNDGTMEQFAEQVDQLLAQITQHM